MKLLMVFGLLNMFLAANAIAAENPKKTMMKSNCPEALEKGSPSSSQQNSNLFKINNTFGGNPQFIIPNNPRKITKIVTHIISLVVNKSAMEDHTLVTELTAESTIEDQLIRSAIKKALNFAKENATQGDQIILFNEDYLNGRAVKTIVSMRKIADNKFIIEVSSAYSGQYYREALSKSLDDVELLPTGKYIEVPGDLFVDQDLSLGPIFNFFKNLFDLTKSSDNTSQGTDFEAIQKVETKRLLREALYQFYSETVHQEVHKDKVDTSLHIKVSHSILKVLKGEDPSYDYMPLTTVNELKALVDRIIDDKFADKLSDDKVKEVFLIAIDKAVNNVQTKKLQDIFTSITLPINILQKKLILIKLQFYYSAHVKHNGTISLHLSPYIVGDVKQKQSVQLKSFFLSVIPPDTSILGVMPTQDQVDQFSQQLSRVLETAFYDRSK